MHDIRINTLMPDNCACACVCALMIILEKSLSFRRMPQKSLNSTRTIRTNSSLHIFHIIISEIGWQKEAGVVLGIFVLNTPTDMIHQIRQNSYSSNSNSNCQMREKWSARRMFPSSSSASAASYNVLYFLILLKCNIYFSSLFGVHNHTHSHAQSRATLR